MVCFRPQQQKEPVPPCTIGHQPEQCSVDAQVQPDLLLSANPLSQPPNQPIPSPFAAGLSREEDIFPSRPLNPLDISLQEAVFNGYHAIHNDNKLPLDFLPRNVSQRQIDNPIYNATISPNTNTTEPIHHQDSSAETPQILPSSISCAGNSEGKVETSEPVSNNEDEMTVSKRRRNTMASRRYRQKGRDRIAELECALRDMERERNELRLRLARKEAEVEALKELLRG
ncbi:hypothetical protein BDV23DRAFT_186236 [Aspergillus alliaceus]|uniref:BZIP domain-containing protein n=2 Tax=Petromyces alliaceus TaxID=209559 RepID=A0A5N7C0M2_PETAA|nr:hypothetical protein BDV23DRAFT_186236 [Aspergillus alliaceus]